MTAGLRKLRPAYHGTDMDIMTMTTRKISRTKLIITTIAATLLAAEHLVKFLTEVMKLIRR